LCVLNDFKLVS